MVLVHLWVKFDGTSTSFDQTKSYEYNHWRSSINFIKLKKRKFLLTLAIVLCGRCTKGLCVWSQILPSDILLQRMKVYQSVKMYHISRTQNIRLRSSPYLWTIFLNSQSENNMFKNGVISKSPVNPLSFAR